MVRTVTAVALLLLVGLASAQAPDRKAKTQTATKANAVDQTIMDTERRLWEAWTKHDPAPFRESLADTMMFVDREGVHDKGHFLDDLVKQPCDANGISLSEMKVTMIGRDSAALTYKLTVDGTCNGRPVQPAYLSSVYTKRSGKWLVVLHQLSDATHE